MEMKAALLEAFGQPLRVGQAARPAPLPDEVLVRVEACGVCHSDLHMAQGDWPDVAARMQLPAILGHEVVGRVVEAGREARGFTAGDRVGVGWLHWTCGECEMCRAGAENVCLKRQVTSIHAPGGFAELIRIKASHAVRIPAGLSPQEAAPLFCAGLTVYHAFRNAGIAEGPSFSAQGKRVAILGVGGLGHLALQLARHAGAEVVAVDVSDTKLALARSLGAKEAINSTAPNAEKQLRAGGGPHVVMVTAGSKSAYDLALRILRRRGTLAVVGLPKEDVTFNADNFVVGEYRIVGSAVGTRQEMRELLDLAAAGKIRCEVETHPLDAVNDILDRMRRGAIAARAVVQFT
jgi:propanol-preferring alcohol dehydrogenase